MKKEDREVCVEYARAIERENTLINHRLTWMIAFHGFRFSAVGFSWEKDKRLIILIAIIGFFVALSMWIGLTRAKESLDKISEKWDKEKPIGYIGLDIQGMRSNKGRFLRLMPARFLPPFFIVCWFVMFCWAVLKIMKFI